MAKGKYERPSESKGGSTAVLIIASLILVLLLAILVFVMIGSGVFNRQDNIPADPTIVTQVTEAPTQPPTEPPTQALTEPPTEPPTEAPTEAPTEVPTQPPTEPPTEAPTAPPPSDKGEAVAALAKSLVGTPYLLGGDGPDAFDTTGFIRYCFAENDIVVSRSLSEQAAAGEEVPVEDLRPGDVLFFWTVNEGEVEYPAIYIGGGKMVAARNSEHPVSEMPFKSEYFQERFLFARRYY